MYDNISGKSISSTHYPVKGNFDEVENEKGLGNSNQLETENNNIIQNYSKEEIFFIMAMFPYPSGKGMHVGHAFNYTATDIIARYEKLRGKKVLHPLGYDSFGLPAENYAKKVGGHPEEVTRDNIANFDEQLEFLNLSLSKERKVITSSPEYYKHTQYLFSLLYKHGLVTFENGSVNFCPSCETQIANSQVKDGTCERCSSPIEHKQEEGMYIDILSYADGILDLLKDPKMERPKASKKKLEEWIGKSKPHHAKLPVTGMVDTNIDGYFFNAEHFCRTQYLLLPPEHPFLLEHGTGEVRVKMEKFMKSALKKPGISKMQCYNTGFTVNNPVTQQDIPVILTDYKVHGSNDACPVAYTFGSSNKGKVPGLSTHLAIQVKNIVEGIDSTESEFIVDDATFNYYKLRADALSDVGLINRVKKFRLQNRSIARERGWGCPIPIYYDDAGKPHLVPNEYLPVLLPKQLGGKQTIEIDGKSYRLEHRTMDSYVDSSFYFLMYILGTEQGFEFEGKEKLLGLTFPVDVYVGGDEHVTGHLNYALFIFAFLKKEGYIPNDLVFPFKKLVHQGMILGHDGSKMSKSKNNGVDLQELRGELSAEAGEGQASDALRMYLHSLGQFDKSKKRHFTRTDSENNETQTDASYLQYYHLEKTGDIVYYNRVGSTYGGEISSFPNDLGEEKQYSCYLGTNSRKIYICDEGKVFDEEATDITETVRPNRRNNILNSHMKRLKGVLDFNFDPSESKKKSERLDVLYEKIDDAMSDFAFNKATSFLIEAWGIVRNAGRKDLLDDCTYKKFLSYLHPLAPWTTVETRNKRKYASTLEEWAKENILTDEYEDNEVSTMRYTVMIPNGKKQEPLSKSFDFEPGIDDTVIIEEVQKYLGGCEKYEGIKDNKIVVRKGPEPKIIVLNVKNT